MLVLIWITEKVNRVEEVAVKGKRTPMMLKYEMEHKLNLEHAIPETYEKYGSLEAMATALGVNINTLYGWMLRLGITIKKTVAK